MKALAPPAMEEQLLPFRQSQNLDWASSSRLLAHDRLI